MYVTLQMSYGKVPVQRSLEHIWNAFNSICRMHMLSCSMNAKVCCKFATAVIKGKKMQEGVWNRKAGVNKDILISHLNVFIVNVV